jgi:outer membrane receptor for ferrienterochelin and colicin
MIKLQGVLRVLTSLCMLWALSAVPAADAASAGKIVGVVTDANTGDPLPNANVQLVGADMGTIADEEGRFVIINVPAGTYTLRATYIGYTALQIQDLRVATGLTSEVAVAMSSSDIQVEEVIIKAERPIIDKNATNAVRIIGAEDLEALPTRSTTEVVALQPGVILQDGALHVRGSRSDEIAYYIEGTSTRNPVTGGSAAELINEAIEEIQVQAGGFNAEYGGATAGVVTRQLRTGGSEWEFSIESEFDNGAADSEQRFGAYNYGYQNLVFTAGGPVGPLRLFTAVQQVGIDSPPIFWDGFTLNNLQDTGDRGGRVHWADQDTPDRIDTLSVQDGNIANSSSSVRRLNTTLLWDLNPIQLKLTHVHAQSEGESSGLPIRNIFNTERLSESKSTQNMFSLKATHLLSASTVYDLTLSYLKNESESYDPYFEDNFLLYSDSTAVAGINPDFVAFTRAGSGPRDYDFNGFPFTRPGATMTGYGKSTDGYIGLSGSITNQGDVHQLKAGFDYQAWEARRYGIGGLGSIRNQINLSHPELEAVYESYYKGNISDDNLLNEMIKAAEAAGKLEDLQRLIRQNSRGDFFGYDEFGRDQDGGGSLGGDLEAPRKPVMASAYLQDKIEYRDLIVNAGIRLDYFDIDSWDIVKDDNGLATINRDENNYTLRIEDGGKTYMTPSETHTKISPRLGFSFPVSDRTVMHVQYGKFAQMPALRQALTGGARLALETGGQNFINAPTAFNLEPMHTTQYEIGFEQQFTDRASFDITGFYRDIKGQIQLRNQAVSPLSVGASGGYNFLQNGDFATTRGIEFVLKVRRTRGLQTEFNYTLQDARGTGSSTLTAVSGVENKTNLPTLVMPLDFNQRHSGSLFLDYRIERQGSLLDRLNSSLLFTFSSGHNYTLVGGSLGQRGPQDGAIMDDFDPRSRKPLEAINSSTTPWIFETDMRISKAFSIGADRSVNVFLRADNLFNRKNVINVYRRTGTATDDGFLTTPELSEQIVAARGDAFVDMFEKINLQNREHYWANQGGDLFSEPRQIHLGFSLDF